MFKYQNENIILKDCLDLLKDNKQTRLDRKLRSYIHLEKKHGQCQCLNHKYWGCENGNVDLIAHHSNITFSQIVSNYLNIIGVNINDINDIDNFCGQIKDDFINYHNSFKDN